MKKKITMLFAALAVSFGFNYVSAQAVSQGNIIIDPYYGFPNWGKAFADAIGDGVDGVNTTSIGPAGIRAEYMVADKFGIGIDFIYNSNNASGTIDSLNSDGTVHSTYDLTIYSQRYRVHMRMNYHFVSTDALDAYVGFGAGYNQRRFGYRTDYPNYENDGFSGALLPISIRVALGMRYYFTDNIGFNAEMGLGGPTLSAGLSLKF